MEKKHNILYKINNNVNGKYYYGIHSTDNLDDGYMGGGLALKSAIKKYGKENFTKEIIADYPTRKEASDHEASVVTFELTNMTECYNLRTGGDNEFTHSDETRKKIGVASSGKVISEDTRKKIGVSITGERNHNFGKPKSDEIRKKISESLTGRFCGVNSPSFGKSHSEESRKKNSESHRGDKHPNFGKALSESVKRKISEASKGKVILEQTKIKLRLKSLTRVQCYIDGVIYNSYREAAKVFKISKSTVSNRIKSKNIKWVDWKSCEDM